VKIVVCVKQVPDTAARVVVQNGKVTWGDAPLVLNPWDEYAVEAALRLAESQAGGSEVIALSLGMQDVNEALKQALAMGCNQAFLISDPAWEQADSQMAAQVLAAGLKKIDGVVLAVFGRQAVDGDSGILAAQTARSLAWPILSLGSVAKLEDRKVMVERAVEEGRQATEAPLPAVISVVKDFGEPRYPSFMGIRKASRAEIPVWSMADLGLTATAPKVQWVEWLAPPSREVTCEFIQGGSAQERAAALADKILAEKVL